MKLLTEDVLGSFWDIEIWIYDWATDKKIFVCRAMDHDDVWAAIELVNEWLLEQKKPESWDDYEWLYAIQKNAKIHLDELTA